LEVPVFSSAKWPTKRLGSCPLFSSAIRPTKIYHIIFVGYLADENRQQYFRRPLADENTPLIFVGSPSRRKYVTHFRRLVGPTKIRDYFRRPREPTKIILFSSVADENSPIFVEFISSAYFRREADENDYFRRHWAYFRRLLADKNELISCSVYGQRLSLTPLVSLIAIRRAGSNG
jgi:hypothetical protein